MGTETKKLEKCIDAFESRIFQELDDTQIEQLNDEDFLRYLDLKGDFLRAQGDGVRLSMISRLAKYTHDEVPSSLFKAATSEEYALSIVYRAKDTMDLSCRAIAKPYFKLEHKLRTILN